MKINSNAVTTGLAAASFLGLAHHQMKQPDQFGCTELAHSQGRLGCQMQILASAQNPQISSDGTTITVTPEEMKSLKFSIASEISRRLSESVDLAHNPYHYDKHQPRTLAMQARALGLTDGDFPGLEKLVDRFSK